MGSSSQHDEPGDAPVDTPPEDVTLNEFAPVPVPPDTAQIPDVDRPASIADALLRRIVVDGESFWAVAYEPFIARDLRRDEMRVLIAKGLEQTRGSYRALTRLFNMTPDDYRRFLNFLRRHDCLPPFQTFRDSPTARRKLRATRSR